MPPMSTASTPLTGTSGAPSSSASTPARAVSCRPAKPATLQDGQPWRRPGLAPASLQGGQVGRVTIDELGRVVGNPLSMGCMEIPPYRCPGSCWTVSAFQHMGDRRTQEDRYTVVPALDPDVRTPCSFFGVFDGTVGDFASEGVKELVVPKLLESPSWRALRGTSRHADQEQLLEAAMRDMYRTVDESLLLQCAQNTQHYATCTSVTLLVVGDVLVVGHLGDSRIILGKDHTEPNSTGASLVGEQLTVDHKPDQEQERTRIERCGGMVERLQNHNNKPFIRGGDFLMRKALGEQPMQLQYSRAFGAKDLKIFGLISVPDVKIVHMGRDPNYRRVRFAILASDGLWDVVSTQQAVLIAQQAAAQDLNPAEALVRQALLEQSRRKGRADNITAVVVQFDHM